MRLKRLKKNKKQLAKTPSQAKKGKLIVFLPAVEALI